MTWKNIIKATLPDFIGIPMMGMDNRGSIRHMGYGIFKHIGDGKYEIVKDRSNWVSDGMRPSVNPNGLSSDSLWKANAALQKIWRYDNYEGTEIYNTIFQGGGSE
jgi:hypothetical protein